MIRGLLKTGIAHGLHLSGARLGRRGARGAADGPLVIGYHRVVEDFDRSAGRAIPAMLVSRAMLARQLDWIERRYRFVTLDELTDELRNGRRPGRRAAAITFDDGFRDVYELAFPLLRSKGIPFAVFVITDLISTGRVPPADHLHLLLSGALADGPASARRLVRLVAGLEPGLVPAARLRRLAAAGSVSLLRALLELLPQERLLRVIAALEARVAIERRALAEHRMMTWEMLRDMRRAGVVVGSHSRTHPLLSLESRERAEHEITGSRRLLEERLGGPIRHFAYPDGSFDAATVAAVAAAGYESAYTTCRHRDPRRPLLTIPRVLLWERSGLDVFGRFSAPVMECTAGGTFDRVAGCRLAHGT